MTKQQLAELAIIEQISVGKTGEIRDIVGFIDCRCGQVAKVVRGKVKVYESCSSCGIKLANGNANTKYILENMRLTSEKPEPAPEVISEHVPENNPEPVPEKRTDTAPKNKPSFLVRLAQAFLAYELFEI